MYDGYCRVSRTAGREGDSFQSPDEQKKAIQQFAKASGLRVKVHPPELDVSGSRLDRPILDRIMARVRDGASEGIIVSKVDRLSRAGLGDAIRLVEDILSAGATVGFAELGNVDPKTPAGEMIVNVWLSIARMQWRQYKASWDTARGNAVARGVFVGPAPLGFTRPGKGQPLVLHPVQAQRVRQAYKVSAEDGLEACLQFCRKTWPSRHWTVTRVRDMLGNVAYRGDAVSGEYVARGVLPPIVDEMLWSLAQHAKPRTRSRNGSYPLSGIARCAACGGPLVGHRAGRKGKERRGYRCTARDCIARVHVFAEELEAIVADLSPPATRVGDDVLRSRQRVIAAEADLENYVTEVTIQNASLFQRGLTARETRLEEARREADEPATMSYEVIVRRGREPLADRVKVSG